MKDKIVFLLGVVFLVFLGCNQITTSNKGKSTLLLDSTNYTDSLTITKDIMFYNFLSNLELFITEHCNDEQSFVVVWCEKEKDNYFINLATSNYCNSNNAEGFLIINDRMVIFDSSCIELGVVDTLMLKKNIPNLYLYDDSQNNQDIFEPYMCRYLIHNNDSIELVFKGYF